LPLSLLLLLLRFTSLLTLHCYYLLWCIILHFTLLLLTMLCHILPCVVVCVVCHVLFCVVVTCYGASQSHCVVTTCFGSSPSFSAAITCYDASRSPCDVVCFGSSPSPCTTTICCGLLSCAFIAYYGPLPCIAIICYIAVAWCGLLLPMLVTRPLALHYCCLMWFISFVLHCCYSLWFIVPWSALSFRHSKPFPNTHFTIPCVVLYYGSSLFALCYCLFVEVMYPAPFLKAIMCGF
jgi:hypothetical protein